MACQKYVAVLALVGCLTVTSVAHAQRLEVPRRHDKPPGDPLSAEEAVAKMTVPVGFTVEIVAAEPDVVNPVGMCIDEKGRFWITESLEYPRREPGPGRDRIKVLEDTDGDGKVDKTTIFADGLNIPSGIAVGHGGVWIANAPDILFLQDTDGDLKVDKIETVVTGFGRYDTHELPNSLTWGPDGWLYGLNGVFNPAHVKYPKSNPNYDADHPGFKLTCAMFRIHPRTREFQVFAEGTSNPWGIAVNDEGDFFISACVIDHLWHIVESAYYIRQGGPYPPHTWPMRSIVDHKHQKAAYCGITWFDSDAYPEEYRGVLYMGNIHGGCINADIAERSGSSYKGRPHPGFPAKPGAFDDPDNTIAKIGEGDDAKLADFLTANDAWFMPVVQKVGPDGCLYVLDWYDRYHCYQDANADPEGVEREKGRLYRVRYKDTPHSKPFDFAKETDEQLIERLTSRNSYVRETARRLLIERLSTGEHADAVAALTHTIEAIDDKTPLQAKLQALWTLGSAGLMTEDLLGIAIGEDQPRAVASWAIRLAADQLDAEEIFGGWGFLHAYNSDPQVKLQILAGIGKSDIEEGQKAWLLLAAVEPHADDPLIQHVAWQNLLPLIKSDANSVLSAVVQSTFEMKSTAAIKQIMPRLVSAACEDPDTSGELIDQLFGHVLQSDKFSSGLKQQMVSALSRSLRQKSLSAEQLDHLRGDFVKTVRKGTEGADAGLQHRLTTVLALLGDEGALAHVRSSYEDRSHPETERIEAIETLVAAADPSVVSLAKTSLDDEQTPQSFRASLIDVLGRVTDPQVGPVILASYEALNESVKPKAIEVLTQRGSWSVDLLKAIAAKQIDKDALNLNQIKRVALFKNDELKDLVAKTYGAVRQDRRSDRQQFIRNMHNRLKSSPGDAVRGQAAFKKVCGQCHKIYGEGSEVGPDITRNGRSNWDQLLQNVFDPSAVIGPGYQARTLLTADGRVLTGLPVEESDQRVVLKIQGGKLETIPRDQIEEYVVSPLSMMPEDLEKQLKPQEIADLFAFLALDKPPSDPTGRIMPGAPRHNR